MEKPQLPEQYVRQPGHIHTWPNLQGYLTYFTFYIISKNLTTGKLNSFQTRILRKYACDGITYIEHISCGRTFFYLGEDDDAVIFEFPLNLFHAIFEMALHISLKIL